jgi:UDP-2,3-diacylglucosamine pyrophosphatase LpxH
MEERMTYLVVSDLHLTSGCDPKSGRWSPTEDFFWDEEFGEFLRHHSREGPCTLVLNGDTFDFLQVLNRPTVAEAVAYKIGRGDIQPQYGLRCSEAASVFQMDKILDGHPGFFHALADFLAGGHNVKIIKGNHDVQLFWQNVQERLLQHLERILPEPSRRSVRRNLEFLPWCLYVPGLLFVEHGNQYEDATSYRNFLNPLIPVETPARGPEVELDLASLLVRYFTNRMEVVNPLIDNVRPLSRYLEIFFRKHPLVFLSAAGTALTYLWKSFRKSAEQAQQRRRGQYRRIDEKNRELLHREAERFSGGDREKVEWLEKQLRFLDARKMVPALALGPWAFFVETLGSPLRLAVFLLPVYVMTYIPLLANWARSALSRLEPSPWVKVGAILLLLRIPQILAGGLLILLAAGIRVWQVHHRRKGRPGLDLTVRLRRIASKASSVMEVRYVTFGHSHIEDQVAMTGGTKYFNTGTWIGIVSELENLYRNVHQFTFLKVAGGEAELLHWDSQARTSRPVVVLDSGSIDSLR